MSLVRDAYRSEILDGLTDAGEEVLHVFLKADVDVLAERLASREPAIGDTPTESALDWALSRLDPAAADRQPTATLVLRSDRLTSAELADQVLVAVDVRQAR